MGLEVCISLFFLLVHSVNAEIVYFIEVARHGARSPTDFVEWDYGRWPDGLESLTPEGMRQHYLIGAELRKRYIIENQVLPPYFNSSLLYLVSSTKERAIRSLQSQLLALYPQTNDKLRVYPGVPISTQNTLDMNNYTYVPAFPIKIIIDDPMLHSKDACDNYKKYIKNRKKTKGYKEIFADYKDIVQIVQNRYNISQSDAEDLIGDIIGSIRSNKFAGYSWDPVFDDYFVARAQELYIKTKYYTGYSPDYIARFSGSYFFNDIIAQLENLKSGAMVRKGSIYSAHDTTLFSIFSTLGINLKKQPDFASVLLFEVVKEREIYYFRILYNMKPIISPGCTSALCPLDTFIKYIKTRVFENMEEACASIKDLDINLSSKELLTKLSSIEYESSKSSDETSLTQVFDTSDESTATIKADPGSILYGTIIFIVEILVLIGICLLLVRK
jgi:Histidine phosphatase superfamily (branch 2)